MLATASAGPTVPAGQSPVDLGTTVDLGPVTLRVHGVARGVAGERKVSTFGAQVQACVSEDAGAPVAFTLGSWRLVEANDESRAAVSDSWETPGDPEAPLQGQLVEPGSCVSSWVVFDESAQLKPEAVGYQNVNGDRIDWRVP